MPIKVKNLEVKRKQPIWLKKHTKGDSADDVRNL